MGGNGFDLSSPRFLLDEDVIPGTFFPGANRFQHLSHGRLIARNRRGMWFCGLLSSRGERSRNWLALAVSDGPDDEGQAFRPPVLLAGPGPGGTGSLFESSGDLIRNACLLLDAGDRLHVLHDDAAGVHHLVVDAAGDGARDRLARAEAWCVEESVAGPGSVLWDAALLLDGTILAITSENGMLYERQPGRDATPICEAGIRAVLHADGSGTCHLAFERDRKIHYLRSYNGNGWSDSKGNSEPEQVACAWSTFPSIATTPDGQVVIAFQGEGKAFLKHHPERYGMLRRSGGCTISYAVLTEGEWRIRDLVRSSEILLKRFDYTGVNRRTSQERFEAFAEEFWRPSLAVDVHGVIWMFYTNTTRRHTYHTRFLGETFDDPMEARGPYDGLSRVQLVQKASYDHPAIGTVTVASGQAYFDRHPVPEYCSTDGRRVVFLDSKEVARTEGLDHQVGQWEKEPGPLCGRGIPGDFEDEDFAWCQVLERDGGFELQYMGRGSSFWSNSMPGRGFSVDGLRWEKRPPANEAGWTLDGGPFRNDFWRPIYLEDPEEADPSRRYKGLLGHWRTVRGVESRWWDVVVSADGKAWHTLADLRPVVTGDISVAFHLLRDEEDADPKRRYKAAMLVNTDSGRGVGVFTSPDLIHWSSAYAFRQNPDLLTSPIWRHPTGPVAIHADAAESASEEEIHDAALWRENGLLMFHYDAFNFDGNQHVDKALAVSRDGRHYNRVKRGTVNMPHGACGEWDSGRLRTAPPIRVGDELRLYFCGMPAQTHEELPFDEDDLHAPPPLSGEERQEVRPWRLGMARMRPDGWARYELARGKPIGTLTTIPFAYAGGQLVVNGSGLGADSLSVEVLAEEGHAVDGYSEDKASFSDRDGVSSRVTWRGNGTLPLGTYRLRFVFRSLDAALYAFGFD